MRPLCDVVRGSVLKTPSANAGDSRRLGFSPWVEEISWRKEWLLTVVFLPGEFHGQRSVVGIIHGVAKSQI